MDEIFKKLFGDFTINNFIKWLKYFVQFYCNPLQTIDRISIETPSSIFSQFLFYFIFSNSFYFLINKSSNEFQSNFNLAIDGILGQFSYLFFFIISSKIVTKKFYLKKNLIFLGLILFSTTPLLVLIYGNFIRFENYVFLYMVSLLYCAIILIIVFFWAFTIERNKKKAFLMVIINLLFINCTQYLLYNIKIDPYSKHTTFVNNDPIFEDYRNIIKNIYSKEKIPTSYLYEMEMQLEPITLNKDRKMRISIGTINGTESKVSIDYNSSEKYKRDIALSIKNLSALDSLIIFGRNLKILSNWSNHFQNIDHVINIHSSNDYFQRNRDSLKHILPRVYLREEIYSNLIVDLMNLEDYHRTIIKNHKNCRNIAEFPAIIINMPATMIDNLFIKYDKKEEHLKYKFEELEDEEYKKYNTK